MLFGFSWAQWLTWLLAAFFVVNGVINIVGPKPMRDSFRDWGFPSYWHMVNGAVLLLTGVLLLTPQLRPLGFLLGALECLAIWITLVRVKALSHLSPSLVMFVILAVAYLGIYGPALPS